MIEISRVQIGDVEVVEAMARLLPQLSSSAVMPTRQYVADMLAREDTHLLVARSEQGEIAGMLTLLIVALPTARKAWIEDVVTDEKMRGCGIGRALVERAIAIARGEGVRRIYLTSNPRREAAHRLYMRCGFEQYDTTLFRLNV